LGEFSDTDGCAVAVFFISTCMSRKVTWVTGKQCTGKTGI